MAHYTVDNPAHWYARVFLDGLEVERVIECDTDQGWVRRYKEDEDGRLFLNADGTGAAEETLMGVVTVTLPDAA